MRWSRISEDTLYCPASQGEEEITPLFHPTLNRGGVTVAPNNRTDGNNW